MPARFTHSIEANSLVKLFIATVWVPALDLTIALEISYVERHGIDLLLIQAKAIWDFLHNGLGLNLIKIKGREATFLQRFNDPLPFFVRLSRKGHKGWSVPVQASPMQV
jgi:hypothetical protein